MPIHDDLLDPARSSFFLSEAKVVQFNTRSANRTGSAEHPLSAFMTEADLAVHAPGTAAARAAALPRHASEFDAVCLFPSEIDLVQFNAGPAHRERSTGGRSQFANRTDPFAWLESAPLAKPAPLPRSQPAIGWFAPAAAAFFIGAIGVFLGLRALDPAFSQLDPSPRPLETREPANEFLPILETHVVVALQQPPVHQIPRTPSEPLEADAATSIPVPSAVANLDPSAEQRAVRRAIHVFEAAYGRLDAAAAAQVWPSVDLGGLARAFAELKFQGLEFHSCAIAVNGSQATADCRGTLQIMRHVGNSAPITAEQQWLFTMRRLAGRWVIRDVSVSQAPPIAALRVRRNG